MTPAAFLLITTAAGVIALFLARFVLLPILGDGISWISRKRAEQARQIAREALRDAIRRRDDRDVGRASKALREATNRALRG